MNLTQLRATIRAYAENSFPQVVGSGGLTSDEQVDTFIQQAEERIYNTVQFPSLRRNVTGFTNPGNQYVVSPADFLAVYSLAVITANGDYEYLLNKDVNFLRAAYPSPFNEGIPKYYAIFGPTTTNTAPFELTNELSFMLAPTPSDTYSLELHYFFYPESITTANVTWLGDNFDSVLLYGALLEAATFMKSEPDVIANYNKRYDEALALAKRLGDGMERQDAYRSGQVRYAVT
jgi:hypothetical protein